MTTDEAMRALREALKADLVETLRTWWDESKDFYDSPQDAIEDALITLETA